MVVFDHCVSETSTRMSLESSPLPFYRAVRVQVGIWNFLKVGSLQRRSAEYYHRSLPIDELGLFDWNIVTIRFDMQSIHSSEPWFSMPVVMCRCRSLILCCSVMDRTNSSSHWLRTTNEVCLEWTVLFLIGSRNQNKSQGSSMMLNEEYTIKSRRDNEKNTSTACHTILLVVVDTTDCMWWSKKSILIILLHILLVAKL